MTNFIDTHTHLYDEAFAEDADAAIERAIDAGVTKMVFPDIDSSSRKAMFELSSRHEGTVFPCLGLHPTSVGAGWEQEYSDMLGEVSRHKIIAIGETGIDCYWSRIHRTAERGFPASARDSLKDGPPGHNTFKGVH